MSKFPMDMTPGDMAEELAERLILDAPVGQLVALAKQQALANYMVIAEHNPKGIQRMYLAMVGVNDDE